MNEEEIRFFVNVYGKNIALGPNSIMPLYEDEDEMEFGNIDFDKFSILLNFAREKFDELIDNLTDEELKLLLSKNWFKTTIQLE